MLARPAFPAVEEKQTISGYCSLSIATIGYALTQKPLSLVLPSRTIRTVLESAGKL
jgi:hypothetical protein